MCVSLFTSLSLISSVMLLAADARPEMLAALPPLPVVARQKGEAQGCRGKDQRERLKHGVWTSRTPWPEEINNPICDLPSGTGSGRIKLPAVQIFASTLLSKYFRKASAAARTCMHPYAAKAAFDIGNCPSAPLVRLPVTYGKMESGCVLK